MQGPGADKGATTDESFWDGQWSDRGAASSLVRFLRSGDHGPGGRFIRLFRAVAGCDLTGKTVVELGGACSRFLIDLAREGALVTAIDYSPVGVQQTPMMFNDLGIDGRVIEADMFSAGSELGSYDIVTHWGLAEHFRDPAAVMRVASSMVARGGSVIFTMPNMEAFGARLWKFFAPNNYDAHVYHSDEALVRSAEEHGLVLVRRFHCGLPLVRMAAPERHRLLALPVSIVHAVFLLTSRIFPGAFVFGHSAVSDARGFVFRRPESL